MNWKEKRKVKSILKLCKKRIRLKRKLWNVETKIDPLYHFKELSDIDKGHVFPLAELLKGEIDNAEK